MSGKASLIVNGAGAVAALIVVGWLGMSWLDKEEPEICEGRYPISTRFDLASASGETVTLSELQARLGLSEWGLLENAKILAPDSDQDRPQLAVMLREGTGAGYKAGQPRGGVGFSWLPMSMREAAPKAACLSYRVYFPEKFDFGDGGTLPGLSIGTSFDPRGEPDIGQGAAVRPGWNKNGGAVVNIQYATAEGWKNPPAVGSEIRWPVGGWVTIEQEVILNEPGSKNGVVRLWLDGKFAGENKKLGLRSDAGLAMAGARADVHFGSVMSPSVAPADAQIRLTPFVLRWQ